MSRTACGAAVDRHEGDRQRHTAVFKLQDATKDRRAEEDAAPMGSLQQEEEEEDYHDEYSDEEYDDGLSGDYEIESPRGKSESPATRINLIVGGFPLYSFSFCFFFSFFFGSSRDVKQTQRPHGHPGR